MPDHGVVGAFRTVHNALSERGLLVDVHPRPHRLEMFIEDRYGSSRIGYVTRALFALEDIEGAEQILLSRDMAHLFVIEEQIEFEKALYYDQMDDWQEYLARPKTGNVEADTDVLNRSYERLLNGDVRIKLRQKLRATRLRRVE